MIVYFTGTGNSRYCAELLAETLSDEIIDSRPFIKDGIAAELISEKPWVFVGPVYAWQMARVFVDFIRAGSFSGNKKAYFVITCGAGIGSAGAYMDSLCKEKGFEYMGTHEAVMPENYVAMFPVPDEEKSRRIINIAAKRLEKRAEPIANGESFPAKKLGGKDKLLSGAVNKGFYKHYVKAKKFYTTDKCTSCGKCVKLCPLNNVSVDDGCVKWGENCTHCMACICYCPAEAIEYGKASIGKRRYKCPEYK